MRQIVLDTETTGLEVSEGHRVIEIACIELNARLPTGNSFHEYINPQRIIEREALEIHGITKEYLDSKPIFSEIAQRLFEFIKNAELIIHNAPFDLGFLNFEFQQTGQTYPQLEEVCKVEDTLELARSKRPGRRNSLNALALEYDIDLTKRVLHGARLDAEILVDVYRALTGGQMFLPIGDIADKTPKVSTEKSATEYSKTFNIPAVQATAEEVELHERWLDYLDEESESGSIWRKLYSQ